MAPGKLSRSAVLAFLALTAFVAALPAAAAGPVVVVKVFVLKHRRAEEAALRVRPFRTESGSVVVETRQNTLTVRDEMPAVERMTKAIASYDIPPRSLAITVTLLHHPLDSPKKAPETHVPAQTKDLEAVSRQLTRIGFGGYKVLDSVVVLGVEGDTISYPIGSDFRLGFELDPTGDEPIARMKGLSFERRRDVGDPWKPILRTSAIHIGVGQPPFVLILNKEESASGALVLVFSASWRGPGPGIVGVR